LGPPRLRIGVPDSRSMLWIDPYDLPVEATKVRILAPPSYALRNSTSTCSRGFLDFLIGASPLNRIPNAQQRRKPTSVAGRFDEMACGSGQANSIKSR
jgi:hypothetical protein